MAGAAGVTLELASAATAGTISGIGSTSFTGFGKIEVDSGAQWTITGANTIASGTTLTNSGTLVNTGTLSDAGTLYNFGLLSSAPGYVVTASGRLINSGSIGGSVALTGGAYLNNSGNIVPDSPGAVFAAGAVTIVNSGTIDPPGFGVYLYHGGTLTNTVGGYIGGGVRSVRVNGAYGATITNAGTLSGNNGVEVGLGTASQTIIDSGTIIGSYGYAIAFGAGNDLLVIDPGAVFVGTVDGAGGTNTLELASAASAGTISGLGNKYLNFSTIQVDAGAQWTITGTNTIAGNVTVTGGGTLTNAGTIEGTGHFVVDPMTTFTNSSYVILPVTLAGDGDVLDNTSTGTINVAGTAVDGTGGTVTVLNAGTINDTSGAGIAIYFQNGGSVANNGSTALISGGGAIKIAGTYGTVSNTGAINATSGFGVYLVDGGSVDNGNGSATGASISGYNGGIRVGNGGNTTTATITNVGTIEGTSTAGGAGVELYSSGVVTNGATDATSALIQGYSEGLRIGVNSPAPPTTVTNYGTIRATGTSGGYGVTLGDGGNLKNGIATSTAATIYGSRYGVADYAGTITNYGSISGGNGGLRVTGFGTTTNVIVNGGPTSTTAQISGPQAVYLFAGRITNFGLIQGAASGSGLPSYFGVQIAASGSIGNDGTIEATGTQAIGVTLTNGGTITNGASTITSALISGDGDGIDVNFLAGTITNYGTIVGTTGTGVDIANSANNTLIDAGTIIGGGGTAVAFGGGDDRLIFNPTDVGIHGAVDGGTGFNTLDFTSGASTGTLTGTSADFVNFYGTVDIGASWVFAGSETIDATASLTVYGSVDITGTLSNSGAVRLTAPGTLEITGSALNDGTITGNGKLVVDPATFTNSGYTGIQVDLGAGSHLDNTSTGTINVTGTAVYGYGVAVSVANAGRILGTDGLGIYLAAGGTVSNTGTIEATGINGLNGIHDGVYSKNGGYVGNAATAGLIYGANFGVQIAGTSGTVNNTGTIEGGTAGGAGVALADGGTVADTGTGALISGSDGIDITGASGSVGNTGTITGTNGAGIYLGADSTITNGSGTATDALLTGLSSGVRAGSGTNTASATITNYGTIADTPLPRAFGAEVYGSGAIVNGSTSDASALITGYAGGLRLGINGSAPASTVTNFGTISGTGTSATAGITGIALGAGGSVSNSGTAALIYGNSHGIYISGGAGDVSNSGVITGIVGAGVYFNGTFNNTLTNAGTISSGGT